MDVAALAISAIAVWLRFAELGRRSLWFDEARAAIGCLDAPSDVADVPVTPLVFASLVRWSADLLGRTEVAVRLPAALFSVAAVVLAYFVARHLAGRAAGRFAAAVVGLLPIPVYYGKELNVHSAELCLALALAALVGRLRRRPQWWTGWVGLVLSVAVGTGLSPMAPLLVAGAFAVLLPTARRAPDAWVTTAAVSALAALAWYELFFGIRPGNPYWHLFFLPPGPPGTLTIATLRSALEAATFGLGTALPHHADSLSRLPPLPPASMYALGAGVLLGAIVLMQRGGGWFVGLTLAWHALLAVAAFAGLYPYGPARIALFFLGPTALLLAAAASGVAAVVPRAVRPVVWLAAIVPLAWPIAGTWRENVSQPFEREELRPVLEHVFAHLAPDDVIWVSPGAASAFRFYVPRPDARTTVVEDLTPIRASVVATAQRTSGRVWLVFAHRWASEEMTALGTLRGYRHLDSIVVTGATAVLVARPS